MNVQFGKSTFTATEIEELQRKLLAHRTENAMSWSELADKTGVPQGTISVWAGGTYKGNNERVATEISRYFDAYAVQLEMIAEAPRAPGYQPTPSSRRIINMLRWAQTGKIIAAACAPGIGKTSSARQYQAESPNVWIATMSPSSRGVQTMQQVVLAALGEPDAKGSPQMLSHRVRARTENTRGCLIIDEAQFLTEQALDEIRGWHDAIGIGIALLGAQAVITRLEGGARKEAFAQLYSRVSMRHIQVTALPEDADMLALAWGINVPQQLAFLRSIASKPGALRQMSMTIELAMFTANGEQKVLGLHHLKDAWTQLSSRPIA